MRLIGWVQKFLGALVMTSVAGCHEASHIDSGSDPLKLDRGVQADQTSCLPGGSVPLDVDRGMQADEFRTNSRSRNRAGSGNRTLTHLLAAANLAWQKKKRDAAQSLLTRSLETDYSHFKPGCPPSPFTRYVRFFAPWMRAKRREAVGNQKKKLRLIESTAWLGSEK